MKTKPSFWESEAGIETFQIFSLHVGVFYELVLKSAKSLNRIFCATESWWKGQKCKICSTNTKPFFWENEACFKTSRIVSLHVRVPYELVLKSAKILNWIFCATECWLKVQKSKICLTNTKPFFFESEADFESLRRFSLHVGVSYKFVLASVKSLSLLWFLFFRVFEYSSLNCWIFNWE